MMSQGSVSFSSFSNLSEPALRRDLSYAHQLVALVGLDDLTYTHITARSQEDPDTYWIGQLGMLFEQATPEKMIRISAQGEIIEGEGPFNITGHYIHHTLYQNNPALQAVIHTHTPATIAVASLKEGLGPYCQFGYLFYEQLGYLEYDALALDNRMENQLAHATDGTVAVLMRNHGALTFGKTLHEAFFYTYFLDKACDVQLRIMATQKEAVFPSPADCRKARDEMIAFEPDLGRRDWDALVKKLSTLRHF